MMSNENKQLKSDNKQEQTERGATMVEYAIMVALIAVVVIGAVTTLGQRISSNMQGTADVLNN